MSACRASEENGYPGALWAAAKGQESNNPQLSPPELLMRGKRRNHGRKACQVGDENHACVNWCFKGKRKSG